MADTAYDVTKLETLADVDVDYAVECSGGLKAFFEELDRFIGTPKNFFQTYNPNVVVFDDNMRISFLTEVEDLKIKYADLGLNTMVMALLDLEYAVEKKNAASLSDWIITFNAKAEETARKLVSAQIAPVQSVAKPIEKPLIMAVDDMPQLLTALVNMLRDEFQVMGLTSGVNALKAIERHSPQLFVLDIEMPGMDGYQLAKQIRERPQFEKTPIIFLTGKNSREAVMEAVVNGGNDYMVKPVDKDLLVSKLRKFLQVPLPC